MLERFPSDGSLARASWDNVRQSMKAIEDIDATRSGGTNFQNAFNAALATLSGVSKGDICFSVTVLITS